MGFHWGANGYLLAIISGDLVSVLFLCITGKMCIRDSPNPFS